MQRRQMRRNAPVRSDPPSGQPRSNAPSPAAFDPASGQPRHARRRLSRVAKPHPVVRLIGRISGAPGRAHDEPA